MRAKFSQWLEPGTHQRLEPAAGLPVHREPAQSPEDLLTHLLTLADAVVDLAILIGTGTFDWGKTSWRFLALQSKDTVLAFKQ
jgi:hypothetical protein